MEIFNLILGSTFILTGIIYFLIAVPLKKGSVKMNNLYGFRIKKAFETEDNWYKINTYGAGLLQRSAWIVIFVGIVAVFLPLQDYRILTLVLSFTPVYVLIPVVIKVRSFAKGL